MSNPADAVQQWPIERLKPYPRNARTHSEAQIAQIAASIKEWGWTTPILASVDGTIIAGHGRVRAATSLGMAEVPVVVADGWSDAQVRAYVLADNRIALSAGWDEELLAVELDELRDLKFDMTLMGFEPGELNDLIGTPNTGFDPDEVPAVPADPAARVGDFWLLGDHRLLCGDSTSPDAVSALLCGAMPHLMVTDPPYGVEYDADWRNHAARHSVGMGNRAIGAGAIGKVLNDDRADWREAWALFPGDVAYVWHAGARAREVAQSLEAINFVIRSQIIWAKQQFAIGRGDYHWKHEPAWYAVRKGKTGHWVGDRTQTTLWEINKPQKSETGHSTQKPVECMRRPIENNSAHGDSVYDPFVGSGTTIIAAEMTGRRACALELNPAYIDVSVLRWQQFTGRNATLDGDGRTFDEVKLERSQANPEVKSSDGMASENTASV